MDETVTTRDDRQAELDALVGKLRKMLETGQKLPPERVLATTLNVKRHRLRSALEIMRERGEVDPRRGGDRARGRAAGAWKALVHATNPLEVIELRLILEPALARLAAVRASPMEIGRIERAATTAPGAAYGAADFAFHTAIAASTRNALADGVYHLLRKVASDGRVQFGQRQAACSERLRERDAEHRRIAEAIAARDPDGAAAAMLDHLHVVHAQVLRRLAPSSPSLENAVDRHARG